MKGNSRRRDIAAELEQRILVLDGATGTCIQGCGLAEADFRGEEFRDTAIPQSGNNDILVLTRPDLVRGIHARYFDAGADIVETDTFNATPVSLADYGLAHLAWRINHEGAVLASLARDEAERRDGRVRFVAGSVGPTKRSLSVPPRLDDPSWRELSFDELAAGYATQIRGLADGGVDLILVETVYDALVAKAALAAADEVLGDEDIPIAVSFTIDRGGRTLAGQDAGAFLASVRSPRVICVGLNCSFGIDDMLPHLKRIAARESRFVSVYPNAGLPDALGNYGDDPESMAAKLAPALADGIVNIVGGCCGTTPAHIAAIARAARFGVPRRRVPESAGTVFSGLEELRVSPGRGLVKVGERTSVTGSAAFRKRVAEGRWDEAVAIAKKQVEAGSDMIDVNMDDALIDSGKAMETFLRLVNADPDVCRVPVMIDSSDWDTIVRGLKCVQGKPLVNSVSLGNGEDEFARRAATARRYGAGIVVMAFDERGQADSFGRRTEIFERSYRILVGNVGFDPSDIVFDPNVLAVGTGMEEHAGCAVDFIRTVAWIKANLPGALTSGGISNLSFAFRGNDAVREAMHAVFLREAVDAGLDLAIVNPAGLKLPGDIDPELLRLAEDVVLNRRAGAAEELAIWARTAVAVSEPVDTRNRAAVPVGKRLEDAVIRGDTEHLVEDLAKALSRGMTPLDLISGPLMAGMDRVGALFGKGEMYLPQVIKSARTMKKAVGILEPGLHGAQSTAGRAGKIVLATVRGDVHDIGKNIFGVVLACNGFEVVDLGVMAEAGDICDAVVSNGADLVGLSGLISPSLEEMRKVIVALRGRGIDVPVMIGGAAASRTHTAVRLAPERPGFVVYAKDASEGAAFAKCLLSPGRAAFLSGLKTLYADLAGKHADAKASVVFADLATAAARPLHVDFSKRRSPERTGILVLRDIPLAELAEKLDWDQYLATWGLRRNPVSEDGSGTNAGRASAEALADAKAMLARVIAAGTLEARAVFGIFPASSDGSSVDIDGRERVRFPRSQAPAGGAFPSLCDFIAPADSGGDHIGVFAATVAEAVSGADGSGPGERGSIELGLLADALADSASEWLHGYARREWWPGAAGIRPAVGYPPDPNHADKGAIWRLLDPAAAIGVSLSPTYAMNPASSVCGFWFAHPDARYINASAVGPDQLGAIAGAYGMDPADLQRFFKS
ncbi:MAG: methionine synthase [Spirochaetes bacterium]|nr:methionine synthase [Spirochaetota bacterium]